MGRDVRNLPVGLACVDARFEKRDVGTVLVADFSVITGCVDKDDVEELREALDVLVQVKCDEWRQVPRRPPKEQESRFPGQLHGYRAVAEQTLFRLERLPTAAVGVLFDAVRSDRAKSCRIETKVRNLSALSRQDAPAAPNAASSGGQVIALTIPGLARLRTPFGGSKMSDSRGRESLR
jgi:hypothetical protein